MKSISACSQQINKVKQIMDQSDAVIVGAGSGLSTSAGLTYSGERFQKNFADFIEKYHFADMYSATFYPYPSLEAYWAYMSRHIALNRYTAPVGKPYKDLLCLLKERDYFVITTNVDHQFQKAGFDKNRLFYTQGDYGLWQCSVPCHERTYENRDAVFEMVRMQQGLHIPTKLIPYCPKCGKPMSMHLRCDHTFVQDEGWYAAFHRYERFIRQHDKNAVLYLELGVGDNTPAIIKYPFWLMTAQNPKAAYVCINMENAASPEEIQDQSVCIKADIGKVLASL